MQFGHCDFVVTGSNLFERSGIETLGRGQSAVNKLNSTGVCDKCGTETLSTSFLGLCPRCLLEEGLESKPTGPHDTARINNPLFIRRFGEYELLEEVARGGMGLVYKARQISLGRIVALKVLSAGEFASPKFVQRFKSEASAAARLQHPNIVKIHEVGEQDGIHYFTMEFVEGPNLAELGRMGPLSAPNAANYLKTLAEAVEYAHEQGVLHRDLKPSNVLIDPFGEPRITDFGLAKELTGGSQLTETGQMLGTPGYMPPEQADSKFGPLDRTADVYSLGAILYFMLTGKPPFASGSLHETLRQVLNEDPIPPGRLNSAVPRDLETICLKCLKKEPARRYQTADEVVAELDRFLTGKPIHARPLGLGELVLRWCHRQPALAALAGLVLILLGILAGGSVATVLRITAARDSEIRERNRAEHTVNQLILQRASDLMRDGRTDSALAHLANVLRKEPTNWITAARIESVLMQHSFALPMFRPIKHGGAVNDVALSGDGKYVATATADGLAGIWDATSGLPMIKPIQHEGAVVSIWFSPDATRLFTASQDGTAHIWETRSGKELTPPMKHPSALIRGELSGNGKIFVTVSAEALHVWNAETGDRLLPPIPSKGANSCLDLNSQGDRIAVAYWSGPVRIWNLKTGQLQLEIPDQGRVECVKQSPDGKLLLIAFYEGHASAWQISTGRKIWEIQHRDVVHWVDVSPDGKRCVTASRDGTARIWNTLTGESLGPPMIHRTVVDYVQFSADGQKLLTTCWDNSAWVWDAGTGMRWIEPIHHDNRIGAIQFSRDGNRLVTGSADRTTVVWDIRPGQQTPLTFRNRAGTGVGFSKDGTRLVTWSADATARVWNPLTGQPITPVLQHQAYIVHTEFSPSGDRVVTASMDNTAVVWNATNGSPIARITGHKDVVESAEFSPDGGSILTGSRDGTARIWDASTGLPKSAAMKHEARIMFAHFNRDGTRVVTCSNDSTARLWDAISGKQIGENMQHDAAVYSVNFSPDGKSVVTGSFDSTARIWDAETGRRLSRPLKHYAGLRWAEFSPDGTRVVTASGDSTARIWDAKTAHPIGQPLSGRGEIYQASFSRDGNLIGTVSRDGTGGIWSGLTGQSVSEPIVHSDWVSHLALSPNNQWFIAGRHSGDAFLWEVPIFGIPAPAWLADLAEAVACQRVSEEGFEFVPPSHMAELRSALDHESHTNRWQEFAEWFYADRVARHISPGSAVSTKGLIERLLEENTLDSLREAIRISPEPQVARRRLATLYLTESEAANASRTSEENRYRQWITEQPEADWARAELLEFDEPFKALNEMGKLEPAFSRHAVFRYAKGRMESRAGLLEEALNDFAFALRSSRNDQPQLRVAAALGWRNSALRISRRDEALTNAALPLVLPSRSMGASSELIDLSAFYNAAPEESWHDITRSWNTLRNLPRGIVRLKNTSYDIRGIVQLSGRYIHRLAPGYPSGVTNIPLPGLCRNLHFLHGTGWAGTVGAGTVIGRYIIHYRNGNEVAIPIIRGEDVDDWLTGPQPEQPLIRTEVAWKGSTPEGSFCRLYSRDWQNPEPNNAIESLDFVSTDTGSAPFLIAVTAD